MKTIKLSLFIVLSIITLSCSNDSSNEITKSSIENNKISNRVDDRVYTINRKLIELQAELGRCYKNPAYGNVVNVFENAKESIDNQPKLAVFISALKNGQFATTFGAGTNINQFRVPVFENIYAVPMPTSGPDFMYLYQVYSDEPCYIKYLNSVKSLMEGVN